jgi:hypothetical protein
MKKFLFNYKHLIIFFSLIILLFIPFIICVSISWDFVDLALFLTAILFVILVLPGYSALSKHFQAVKERNKTN